MHSRTAKAILLAAVALLACAALAGASSDKSSRDKAAKWMRNTSLSQFPGTGFRADAVGALTAAGQSSSAKKRFLDSVEADAVDYGTTAGAAGKVILAAVAGGKNPRCFGTGDNKGDFYGRLMSHYDEKSGKFGLTAFDQGLAMVALKAAHQKVPSNAVKYAKNARGKRGWNFALNSGTGDDIESTALLIEGLRAAGVSKNDKALRSAYDWIKLQANTNGGYNPSAPAGETQADTTAYAIRAADALGINNNKAKRALRALQRKNGYFRSSEQDDGQYHGIATQDALTAISGAHLPVRVRSKAASSCG